jgi:exoribonuclease R
VPVPKVFAPAGIAEVREGMGRVRAELGVQIDHPPEVVAAATAAAETAAWRSDGRPDRTSVELVTIDPPGSKDLDQAFAAERRGSGYRVWYAIADVAAFVEPGGVVDQECHRRGLTLYGPDARASLHPPVLSEGAASLLPGDDRPALLWCIDLDAEAVQRSTRLERAVIRSRAQLTYRDALGLELLREIGERRQALEVARGGVSLVMPEQIIEPAGDGYRLAYEAPIDSEESNAQISLLAGMEAARIMLAAGAGLLRTLEGPDDRTLARLRRSAEALGVPWPPSGGYPAFVRSLDPATPAGAALLVQAAHALRSSGYVGFKDGDRPERPVHAAVAAPYAHVTAPLRRLCDGAANEVVLAEFENRTIPAWAKAELDTLPDVMAKARSRESAYGHAALDLVEALVLKTRVGECFDAVVVDIHEERERAVVQLRDPAVVASVSAGGVKLGEEVAVRLIAADPVGRRIELEAA